MASRNSTALRRSPRFLHHINLPEPQAPKTPILQSNKTTHKHPCRNDEPKLGKSNEGVNFRTGLRRSSRLHVGIEDLSTPGPSLEKTNRGYTGKLGEELNKSSVELKRCVNLSTGSRKSVRLHGGVEGFSAPDASLKQTYKNCGENEENELKKSRAVLEKCGKSVTGSRKSSRLGSKIEGPSGLRKSARFSYQENNGECVEKTNSKSGLRISVTLDKGFEALSQGDNDGCVVKTGDEKCNRFNDCVLSRLSSKIEGPSGLRKSPRFSYQENNGERVEKTHLKSGLRKSARLDKGFEALSQGDIDGCVIKTGNEECNRFSDCVLSESSKEKALVVVGEEEMGKRETTWRSSYVALAALTLDGRGKNVNLGIKEMEVNRKRNRWEEGNVGPLQGWTKEQELALQKAYFAANPTPHFWKRVSKMVPGKSAQECFDKVHADHLTPPPQKPRSRASKSKSSSEGSVPLSASKMLKATDPKIRRPRCNKQKTHLTQKAVRHLLQNHYEVNQDYEADLFSVLEPTATPSTQALQQSTVLSTPEHVKEKSTFLQMLRERSSSGHKKPHSRFSSPLRTALASPPVLKPVKNRALHEKYIDQLHCREAKRKMASAKSAKAAKSNSREEDRKEDHVQKMNAVRAARNALVCDARDAINQFQHRQVNFKFDDEDVNIDEDDEAEYGT